MSTFNDSTTLTVTLNDVETDKEDRPFSVSATVVENATNVTITRVEAV
jgi:hypothetical protein